MTKTDRGIGVILLAIGFLMMFKAFTMDYPELSNDPGPALFPKVISFGLIFCGVGLLVMSIFKVQKKDSEKVADQRNIVMLVLFATLTVYIFIFETVGFIISTILFLTFTICFLSKMNSIRNFLFALFLAVISTGLIYIIFFELLGIRLPSGIL